ncbi:MAG: futalosine hydrolase [Planctomycetes bacterium]|nr:futalosine hydrolase [Planctomycetota bacterium]
MNLNGWLPVCAAPVEAAGLEDLGVLVAGVGKVAFAVGLTRRLLQQPPHGVLLFGVAGAYPARHRPGTSLGVGDLCVVASDRLADEGVVTTTGFTDLAAMGLGESGPFAMAVAESAWLAARLRVPLVVGATVSTCSGTEMASATIAARAVAEVESMEGAAAAFVCARAGVPLVQLRAISNLTGDRDRGGWDLRGAVAKVQAAVRLLLA